MMMKRKQIGGRNNDDDDDGSCSERIRYDSPIISFSRILGEVGIISWARGRHPESLADVVVAWLSSTVDKSQRRIWRKSWAPLQTSLLPPLVSPYLSRQLFFHVFLLFLSYSSVHISEEPSLCLYPVSFLSIAGQRERGEGGGSKGCAGRAGWFFPSCDGGVESTVEYAWEARAPIYRPKNIQSTLKRPMLGPRASSLANQCLRQGLVLRKFLWDDETIPCNYELESEENSRTSFPT